MDCRSEISDLIELLREKGLTISFAESCTGGMVGAMMTDEPGVSDVFMGSAVTYSNGSKESLLGVRHDTLTEHGAVSEETAKEMATGARRAYSSDIAASVTGIAGPSGATDSKPIGLVFIAVTDGTSINCSMNRFSGDRDSVRRKTVHSLIRYVTDFVGGL